MEHTFSHDRGKDAAREAAEAAFESYRVELARYQPTAAWRGDRAEVSFRAVGKTFRGSLTVREDTVLLQLNVPLALRPFKKRAIAVVDRELRRWLDPATSPDAGDATRR